MHAAGVLADGILSDMTLEQLDRAMAPKVQGAWNLHVATKNAPLDCFVLFSSVASVLGSPGQANYAAGNAYLMRSPTTACTGSAGDGDQLGPVGRFGDGGRGGPRRAVQSRGMRLIEPERAWSCWAS